MCSKLSATFVPFSVLSLIRPRTIKVASTSRLSFALFTWQKIPGSPRLHNFNFVFPSMGAWEPDCTWYVVCPPLAALTRRFMVSVKYSLNKPASTESGSAWSKRMIYHLQGRFCNFMVWVWSTCCHSSCPGQTNGCIVCEQPKLGYLDDSCSLPTWVLAIERAREPFAYFRHAGSAPQCPVW